MRLAQFFPQHIKLSFHNYLYNKKISMSQVGQDLWVICLVFNFKKRGYFVDVGAHNGIELSNTYILESQYDWEGILVEANPETYMSLKENRNSICVNACVDSNIGFVDFFLKGTGSTILPPNSTAHNSYANVIKIETKTLVSILEEQDAPCIIDYLSIDIEGAEERALSSFDFNKYKFNCITIERPSNYLKHLLQKNGYILIKEIPDLDCFYIHRDFMDTFKLNSNQFRKKRFIGEIFSRDFYRYLTVYLRHL